MKKLSLFLVFQLGLGCLMTAQLTAPMFNTASQPSAYTGFRPYYMQDVAWTVAQTPDGSTATPPTTGYIKAVSQDAAPVGWYNPHVPMTIPNAGWITYPNDNTCPGQEPAYHGCLNDPIAGWGVDQWYKLQFYICCEQDFCINLNMWADNRIQDVFVNTNITAGPGYWKNPFPGAGAGAGTYQGYLQSRGITNMFCDNWHIGLNTIIIHIVSHHPTNNSDYAGLLVECNEVTNCEGVMYFPPDEDTGEGRAAGNSFNTNGPVNYAIANELRSLYPELSSTEAKDLSSGNDGRAVNKLLKTIKSQQNQINLLKNKNGTASDMTPSINDQTMVVLNQNVPNPFAESTLISYMIPETAGSAQLVFSTENGAVVRRLDLTQKGSGSIRVYANDLSKGIYTYTLMVDGRAMMTKKMIKE